MYTNPKYLNELSEIAKTRMQDVITALSLTYKTSSQNSELVINAWGMTPERIEFMKKMYKLSPQQIEQILPLLKKEHRALIAPNITEMPARGTIDTSLRCSPSMIKFYEEYPDLALKQWGMFDSDDYGINRMIKDKNSNYSDVLISLLSKKPNEFFELLDKTNCLWHAAGNDKQGYLEFIECCLIVNPAKTIDLLSRKVLAPTENRYVSAYTKAIENPAFNSTELMKATYQASGAHAFSAFNDLAFEDTSLSKKTDEKCPNLLTYYVDKKGVEAEDFITYLTNFDLLFVRSLLSVQTLQKLQNLKYEKTMQRIDDVYNKLVQETGNEISAVKKQVLDAVREVHRELFAHECKYIHQKPVLPKRVPDSYYCKGITPSYEIPNNIHPGSMLYAELSRLSGSLAYGQIIHKVSTM